MERTPTKEEWRRLYQAVIHLKSIAPWNWMEETDVFGVQNPETNELGFVSVSRSPENHPVVSVYLGSEGLSQFWKYIEDDSCEASEMLFNTLHLHVSFGNRDTLRKEDREIIKELGLKFRGRQAWPIVRSCRPASVPWFLEAWEVRFLAHALEQAAGVVLRFKADPTIFNTYDDETYFVRVPRKEAEELLWEDNIIKINPESQEMPLNLDMSLLADLRRLPLKNRSMELDFFMIPFLIDEKGKRPYFSFMLMAVDAESSIVLNADLMKPLPTMKGMLGKLPERIVSMFFKLGFIPRKIDVCSHQLFILLEVFEDKSGFIVNEVPELRSLNQARNVILHRIKSSFRYSII